MCSKYLFYAIVFDVAGNQVGSRSAGSALEIQTSSLVEFSPNGNTTWEKEHSTTVTILDTAVDAKYCWTNSTSQPAETQFTENQTFASGDTISKDGVTGTYYLWTLIETTDGTKSYCKSEGFNFDNEGPNITSFTATKSSATAIAMSATAQDTGTGVIKFEFYVDNVLKGTQTCTATTSSVAKTFTATGLTTGSHTCKVIVYDAKNNSSTKTVTGTTKVYSWDTYEVLKKGYFEQTSTNTSETWSNSPRTFYSSYKLDENNGYTGTGSTKSSGPSHDIEGWYYISSATTMYKIVKWTNYTSDKGSTYRLIKYKVSYRSSDQKGNSKNNVVYANSKSTYPTNRSQFRQNNMVCI